MRISRLVLFVSGFCISWSSAIAQRPEKCPDPSAAKIRFELVERITERVATVQITGVVTNRGGADFVSGPCQQAILLYETHPGAKPSLVARKPFEKLAAGKSITIAYKRQWDTREASLSEFSPTYRLCVSYDPDIYSDENPKNDDCVSSNNCHARNGMRINRLFDKPWAPDQPYMLEFTNFGEPRRAKVFPPICGSGLAPAVIYFHGRGGTVEDSEVRRDFHTLWPEAYVVYAEGTNFDGSDDGKPGWEIRFPHVYTYCGYAKDYDYVDRILRHLAQTQRVDTQRLFASGHSSGGFFTLALMEIMPVFRAYAAVGCYSQYDPDLAGINCGNTYHYRPANAELDEGAPPASQPRPVLYMFGDNDTVFDNNGSDETNSPGYDPDCDTFSKSNKTLIELTARNRAAMPTCPDSGIHYMLDYNRQRFAPQSRGGAEVQFQLYQGRHSWPTSAAQPGNRWVIDYFKSF